LDGKLDGFPVDEAASGDQLKGAVCGAWRPWVLLDESLDSIATGCGLGEEGNPGDSKAPQSGQGGGCGS
jgi:hypothetical protein